MISSYLHQVTEPSRLVETINSHFHVQEKRTYCCSGLDTCAKTAEEEDIAEIMKRRALAGYGLTSLNNVVKELTAADKFGEFPGSSLEWIWQWLCDSKALLKEKEKQSQWRFDLQ